MSTDAPSDAVAAPEAHAEVAPNATATGETLSSPEKAPDKPADTKEPETVLTLAEAARTVGLSERALRKHIQRGRLVASSIVRNGRTIAAVDLDTLKRTYGELQMVPTATVRVEGESGPRATRLRSKIELEQRQKLKEQLRVRHELEARMAKLKALLGMERAQKKEMQRQMQFLADSLARAEARLEQAHEASRGLALDLGVARGRSEELERRLTEAETGETQVDVPRPVRPVELDSDPVTLRSRGGVRN